MGCYCCVVGCKSNNHKQTDKHFFRFPARDVKRHKLWQLFARKSVKATAVICEDHFEEQFMVYKKDKKLKLTKDAVPTVFYRKTEEGLQKVSVAYNGEEYCGEEAALMSQEYEKSLDQEMVAIETAFVNELSTLEEMKLRCRFCAELKDNLIELDSFASYNIDVRGFLQSLSLQIIESDFFPSSVCEDCFNQVLSIDAFVVKCKGTDQWFLEEIGKLKTITAAVHTPADVNQPEIPLQKDQNSSSNEEAMNETVKPSDAIDEEPKTSKELIVEDNGKNDVDDEEAESTSQPKIQKFAIMDPSLNKFAVKNYHCSICLKVFAGLKTYKNHLCDVAEIKCDECGDIFPTRFALKAHKRHLHKDDSGKNYCPICKTVITGKLAVFRKHKSKCNRERVGNINCDSCQLVSFSEKS
jgi:THAP domain